MNWGALIAMLEKAGTLMATEEPPLPGIGEGWWENQFAPAYDSARDCVTEAVDIWLKTGKLSEVGNVQIFRWSLYNRFVFAQELASCIRISENQGLIEVKSESNDRWLRWLLIDAWDAGEASFFNGLLSAEEFAKQGEGK